MALPFLCSVVAAGVSPAAVLPAGMAFAVALPVVGAQHVRQKDQLARQQIRHGLVRAAGDAAVQLDARLGQGVLAPPPMPPHRRVSTPWACKKPARAPWPEPLVPTT